MFNQPATKNGAERCSDRSESRPRSNRMTPAFLVKGGTDDGETARHQERSAHALNASCEDQFVNVRGDSAPHGRQSE